MRSIVAFFVLALTVGFLTAQGPQPVPAPTLHVLSRVMPEKGHAIITQSRTVFEERFVVERVMENGMVVEVKRAVKVPVQVEYHVVYDIASSRVITPDGKQLPIDEVWKRLKANTVVAISGNFETPSASYLQALNPNTLVIIPAPPKKEVKK